MRYIEPYMANLPSESTIVNVDLVVALVILFIVVEGILSILGTNLVSNVANELVAFSSVDMGEEILTLVVRCL